MQREAFQLVEPSPWPLIGSLRALRVTSGFVRWFFGLGIFSLLWSFILIILTIINWWRDVIRESLFIGYHTSFVKNLIRSSIIFFIVSEVIFFFSFFWGYFHRSLSPSPDLGGVWPPTGVSALDAFGIPLLGTVILLTSRGILTFGHHRTLIEEGIIFSSNKFEFWNSRKCSLEGVLLRIILGVLFLKVQFREYQDTSYFIRRRVYGSIFFLATGFHGLHVILGVLFLGVIFFRIMNYHFSINHHVGFEGRVWYWHFVDVVWLFLFIIVYWWGNRFFY